MWEFDYCGILHADGRTEYKLTGFGIGGSIDGLLSTATATRGPLPTDPYLFSGIITRDHHHQGRH